MDFNIVEVFKRSVTLELTSDTPYESEHSYDIYINGRKIQSADKNVVSIFGLCPDTSYEIYIVYNGEISDVKSFVTEYEFVLLNVRDFGAAGDGISMDSVYIQAAISACPKHGTVYIPEGVYRSLPIFLKSNISLWIDRGAVIAGETDRRKYPVLPGMTQSSDESCEYNLGSWEGNPLDSFASLITGIEVTGVDIFGEGVLDGRADEAGWWENAKKKHIAWRPNILFLYKCRNIRMQGLTVMKSPSWTLHPYYSDNLKFLNNTVINPDNSPNTDGLDPESCENVQILGANISVGDDCIAIKSGKYYMALNHYKPAKNIVIRNCIFKKGHGSVTIGSEVSCGVMNVSVTRCIFDGTDRGLRLKTRRGRGERSVLTDIVFDNIYMKDVSMPFTVNMFYFCDPDGHSEYVQSQEIRAVDERTPGVGRLTARNIICSNVKNVLACFYGLPEMPIEELEMSNIYADFDTSEITPAVPIMMDNFPEMVKKGIFAKNIKKLILKNIHIKGSLDDNVFIENIADCESSGLEFEI